MDKSLNIVEFLASGQLELYVAGVLPTEEASVIASLVKEYPEIRKEVEMIENSMMAYAGAFAGENLPDRILDNALAQIDAEQDSSSTLETSKPSIESADAVVRNLDGSKRNLPRWVNYLAAATLVLSLGFNIWLYIRWQDTDQLLNRIIVEREQIASDQKQLRTTLDLREEMLAHLSDPSSQEIILEGVEAKSAESQVRVVWNASSSRVLLKVDELPTVDTDKQYQLWAIIDGQPVDAGLLRIDQSIQWMKEVSGQPAAFAITLEPAGGSPNPTLDEMYVIGSLS